MQVRWQLYVLVACVLVCVFAFNAKLSQYESFHNPVTNLSSNKIWSSTDKRAGTPATLADSSAFRVLAEVSVLLLAFIVLVDSRTRRAGILEVDPYSPALVQVSTAALFRRPPPVL